VTQWRQSLGATYRRGRVKAASKMTDDGPEAIQEQEEGAMKNPDPDPIDTTER